MALTPDIAEKLLAADDARIVERLKKGQRLTVGERARLEALTANPQASAAQSVSVARSWVELAAVLNVTRKTIHKWVKLKGSPPKRSNGTIDVAEWRAFCRARGLRSDEPAPNEEDDGSLEPLKRRKLLAEILEREHRLGVRQREYIPAVEIRETWGRLVGDAITLLRKRLEDEAPPVLSGMDAVAIRSEMGRVIDEFIALMHEEQAPAS